MTTRAAGARAFVRPGLLVTLSIFAANALNAGFQLALARLLVPAEYSLLAALIAVTLVAAIPPVALETSLAREIALHLADGREAAAGAAVRETLRGLRVWIAATLGVAALAYPILAITSGELAPAMLATAATSAAALTLPVAWGALQGAGRFGAFSLAQISFAGTRLVAGIAIGLAGGDATAVMAGVAAATLLTLGLSLLPLRWLWHASRGAVVTTRRLGTRLNVASATGLTVLTALTSADLVVAQLALGGSEAGGYAAASVAARVLLLVPIGVTTVLFPHVATLRDPIRERRHLLVGLAVVAAIGAAATVFLWVLSGPVVELAFGPEYDGAKRLLGPLALAMALYALVWNYLLHFLSVGRARYALVLVSVFTLQLAAFAAFHERPDELVAIQLATAAATLLSAEVWYLARHR